jgi:ABC-type uncharacterized transport system permease subunit
MYIFESLAECLRFWFRPNPWNTPVHELFLVLVPLFGGFLIPLRDFGRSLSSTTSVPYSLYVICLSIYLS